MGELEDRLRDRRKGYNAECEFMRFLLDAFNGSGGFRGKTKRTAYGYFGWAAEVYSNQVVGFYETTHGNEAVTHTYLDRYHREDEDKFESRIEVAHYTNYMKPLTELKVSYLNRREPSVNDLPEELGEWAKDVTGNGLPMAKFRRNMALRAAVFGWVPVLVDAPQRPEGEVSKEQFDSKPYLRAMLPANLADYRLDSNGDFLWAKLVFAECDQGSWTAKPVEWDRYVIWTATDFSVYRLDKESDQATLVSNGLHSFGKVPVTIWRTTRGVEDPVHSESMHADVAIQSRRLFNLHSEFDEHMRAHVFSLLVLSTDAEIKQVIIGTNNALKLDPQAKNPHYFLSPPSSVAETYERRIQGCVQEMYRMARVEFTRPSGTSSSAQSRREEFEQTNLAIGDMAQAMAEAEEETYRIVAAATGVDVDELAVVAAENFDTQKIAEEIDETIQALQIPAGPTYRAELVKRFVRSLMPDLDPDVLAAIETEVDDEATASAQQAAALRESLGGDEGSDEEGEDEEGEDEDDEQMEPGDEE